MDYANKRFRKITGATPTNYRKFTQGDTNLFNMDV